MSTKPALKSVDTEAPVYNGPIFDADTHMYEPDFGFFKKYLPEKYHAEWLIERKRNADGRYGLHVGDELCENADAREDGKVPPPGRLKDWLRAINEGVAFDAAVEPTPDMYDFEERVKKLDEFGVEAAVVFIGQWVGAFGVLTKKAQKIGPEGCNAVLHAWNEYVVSEASLNIRERAYVTGALALFDRDWAIQEAKYLAENGARIVIVPMGPIDGRSPADPYFDPVWQVLNDAGIVVSFHVSEANFMHPLIEAWGEKAMTSRRAGQTAWQWMFAYSEIPVMMTMANFVYWNFFSRFPNIKMVSVENGAEWLPRFLYKMDKMRGMARNGFWPMGQLTERPSAIFKRHCFVVAYPEDNIARIAEDLGGDVSCLLMGSDYPHAEGVPTPRDFVAEGCRGLTDEQIEKIMYSNGKRMMEQATA